MTQIKLLTSQINQNPSEPVTSDSSPSIDTYSVLILYAFGLIVAWVTAMWATTKPSKASSRHQAQFSQSPIPCRNCHFFNNNYYLKCAVNPSIVLTRDAISCSDYCSTKQ